MANWLAYNARRYSPWTKYGRYGRYGYPAPQYNLRTRTARRRANGEARAARQQRDTATVTINRIHTERIVILQNDSNSYVAINHWDSLRQSQYYPNYAPMYDQMKIDKIRVKITGNQAGTAQTSNVSPAVVCAFDRNGLSAGQVLSSTAISTYSSAQLKQWSSGNAFAMYQNIYPSSIMEKGMYIPTESLQDPQDVAITTNPCTLESDPTLPFKPVTFISVDLGFDAPANQTFAFTVEYEYTVTFRGMRKPSLASSAAPLDLSITANGQYSYADAYYNPVTIDVNVGSYHYDRFVLLAWNGLASANMVPNVTVLASDFIQADTPVTVQVEYGHYLIARSNNNYSIAGKAAKQYSIYIVLPNQTTQPSYAITAGTYYAYGEHTITQTNPAAALGRGNNISVVTGRTTSANPLELIYIDEDEDFIFT